MAAADRPREGTPTAGLIVTTPSGSKANVIIERLPFIIGRLGDNDLVLRDGRASRHHARIVAEGNSYAVEDLKSSYGVYVNGDKVERATLRHGDRIEFGFADSYSVVFTLEHSESRPSTQITAGAANLAKLRATLEVVRALQTSLSTDEVLATVVEAALTVTGCERGFLLLRKGDGLEIRVARSRSGTLPQDDLRVPTRLLLRALAQRREFLSMNFDPSAGEGTERTIADMELRSVVCLPLVRIRAGGVDETSALTPFEHTVGMLYMDSRLGAADLSAGGRELLTTLALEASTVLENARLIEELWVRQRTEQELRIAREIQASLLPRSLPTKGWFRAAGSSTPSLQVGGDCFDVRPMNKDAWVSIVADVSGKGVGAALLAALIEGMFLAAPYTTMPLSEMMSRANRFLNERTGGEQYATVFFCAIERNGRVYWANAGHPPPLLVSEDGHIRALTAAGVPIGLLEDAEFPSEQATLRSGDKLVVYSDGLTEAQNPAREFFGLKRLREAVALSHRGSAQELHDRLLGAVNTFTAGGEQRDDVTLAVLEYNQED